MFGVLPYLETAFGGLSAGASLADSLTGLIVIVFLVLLCGVFYGNKKNYVPVKPVRLDSGDIQTALGTMFSEKKLIWIGCILSAVSIIISLGFMIGTLVRLLGGAA